MGYTQRGRISWLEQEQSRSSPVHGPSPGLSMCVPHRASLHAQTRSPASCFLARHHRSFELASNGGIGLASGAVALNWELWAAAMLGVLVLGPASQKFQPRLKTEGLAWRGVGDIADPTLLKHTLRASIHIRGRGTHFFSSPVRPLTFTSYQHPHIAER
jgi:hypothetical protein